MRKLAILLLLAGCVAAPAPDRYEQALIASLRANDCRFTGDTPDTEARLAAQLSPYLGVPPEALLDRSGPHYEAINAAIDRIVERGDVIVEDRPQVVTLVDCP